MNWRTFSPIVALLCITTSHATTRIKAGFGTLFQDSVYKGHDNTVIPFPFVTYQNDTFYLQGAEAGIFLDKEATQQLTLGVNYFAQSFDPNKTSDSHLSQLDSRQETAMLSLTYRVETEYCHIQAQIKTDLLNKTHGGSKASLEYMCPISLTTALLLMPGVGASFSNSALNQYYYGVSGQESALTGMAEYAPGQSVSTYVNVGLRYKINKRLQIYLVNRLSFLPAQITASPMVERDQQLSSVIGITYQF